MPHVLVALTAGTGVSAVAAGLAAADTGGGDFSAFLNYGLAGTIVVVVVIPMTLYIKRIWEKQLEAKDAEIVRLRSENAEMRQVLEKFPPAIQDMTRTMSTAIQIVERARPTS